MISIFYSKHDLKMKINERYAFQEIERSLISFLSFFRTKDRLLLNKIMEGTCKRFGCPQFYSDKWLTNKINHKKKPLEAVDINSSELIEIPKNRPELEDTKHYPFKPNKKECAPNNYKKQFPHL